MKIVRQISDACGVYHVIVMWHAAAWGTELPQRWLCSLRHSNFAANPRPPLYVRKWAYVCTSEVYLLTLCPALILKSLCTAIDTLLVCLFCYLALLFEKFIIRSLNLLRQILRCENYNPPRANLKECKLKLVCIYPLSISILSLHSCTSSWCNGGSPGKNYLF